MRVEGRTTSDPESADTPAAPSRDSEAGLPLWASDVIVDLLAELGVEYVTINPGASLRGLHDSLVNHATQGPRMLLCLHEDAAVSIAHGYAKVTGQPMAVFLHANVGVLHGSMGVFNAFCDRVPMIVVGGNGPLDVDLRRPWIDWVHTSSDLGSALRGFVKWDAAPTTLRAAVDDLVTAAAETHRAPRAPVFVTLDRALQEKPVPVGYAMPDLRRFRAELPPEPPAASVDEAVALVQASKRPVLMVGRVGRSPKDWERRIRLAEAMGAAVLTDFKTGAGFPTAHPLHVGSVAGLHLVPEGADVLRETDLIVALDWIDLGSTLRQVFGSGDIGPRVLAVGMDAAIADRWAEDGGARPPADLTLFCEPDVAVARLLGGLGPEQRPGWHHVDEPAETTTQGLQLVDVITATRNALGDTPATLVRAPHRGWAHRRWEWTHPLDYLGYDGGAGLGSGPGMIVGAAIGLRGTDRLAVGVIGDGDYLQGCTALWTAAHERVPLLMVVANNGTYQTDEAHQELIARHRGRDPERRWVGQRMADPRVDLAELARAQGAVGFGPVTSVRQLLEAVDAAVRAVHEGSPVVLDVHVGEY